MSVNKIYAEQLVNEYTEKKESKVLALKKLDRKAKLPADIFAYSFGLTMSLVLGLGMCLSMHVFGNTIFTTALGVVIGMIGLVGIGLNYPYKKIKQAGKKKYSYDIITLAKQITDEEK